jgi:alpha-ribazole phosphatase
MEIYLIRHTPTTAEQGICYGQTDLELKEPFQAQFNNINALLPEEALFVYASPLTRCRQLALYLAGEQKITLDDRLQEINFGLWENIPWSSIKSDELDHWMNDFVNVGAPEGESFLILYERVVDFINELLSHHAEKDKVMIVSHAGVIRCFLSYLLATPLSHVFKMPVDFGSITKMNLYPNTQQNTLTYLNKV